MGIVRSITTEYLKLHREVQQKFFYNLVILLVIWTSLHHPQAPTGKIYGVDLKLFFSATANVPNLKMSTRQHLPNNWQIGNSIYSTTKCITGCWIWFVEFLSTFIPPFGNIYIMFTFFRIRKLQALRYQVLMMHEPWHSPIQLFVGFKSAT